MAKEEAAPAPDAAAAAEKPKKGGALIIIMLLMNLLLVGGLGAYIFLVGMPGAQKGGEHGKEAAAEGGHEGGGAEGGGAEGGGEGAAAGAKKGQMGPVVEFDPFLVNLDEAGQSRYLKTTIQFEMSSAEAAEEAKQRTVPIRDLIITYLSSLNFTQTQGQVNKEIIRTSLMKRVNASMSKGEVKNLYFTDFVIQ